MDIVAMGMIGKALFMLASGKVAAVEENRGNGFHPPVSISFLPLTSPPNPLAGGDNPTDGDDGAVVARGLSDCVYDWD
jgi:hypothetical protein